MRFKIYIDLDRTLFNSGLFWQDTVDVINIIKNQSYVAKNLENEYSSLFDDGSHYINFIKLLKDNSIDINDLRIKILKLNRNYLLSDAEYLLNWFDAKFYNIEIITIGCKTHQKFKLLFCNRLDKYSKHIINCSKNKYIKQNLDKKGILIDDKPDQKLPSDWLEFNINRQDNLDVLNNNPLNINKNVWVFCSLRQIPQILQNYI